MKRTNRIRKNNDFKRIINNRNLIKSNEFNVYYCNNNLSLTRIGISVSSKIANAVMRNRIKRQIKSFINDLMTLDKNIDIVIIVREDYKKNTYQQNLDSFKKVIKRIP